MQAACPARARAAAAAGRSSHAAARAKRRAAACMSRTNVQYERVDYKAVHAALPKMGKDVWNTTYYPTAEDARSDRRWVLLDAQDLVLGRLATEAAVLLRGKNVTEFHPAMDMGANVIIVNAEKVRREAARARRRQRRQRGDRRARQHFTRTTSLPVRRARAAPPRAVRRGGARNTQAMGSRATGVRAAPSRAPRRPPRGRAARLGGFGC